MPLLNFEKHDLQEFFRKLSILIRGLIMVAFVAYFVLPITLPLTVLIGFSVVAVLSAVAVPLIVLWEKKNKDRHEDRDSNYFGYAIRTALTLIPLGLFITSVFLASPVLLAITLIAGYLIPMFISSAFIMFFPDIGTKEHFGSPHGIFWRLFHFVAVVLTSILLLPLPALPLWVAIVCVAMLAVIAVKQAAPELNDDVVVKLTLHTSTDMQTLGLRSDQLKHWPCFNFFNKKDEQERSMQEIVNDLLRDPQ